MNNAISELRFKKQRKITIVSFLLISKFYNKYSKKNDIILFNFLVFYLITWSPYALRVIHILFINNSSISMWGEVPGIFAKSSLVWPAILNLSLLKRERRDSMVRRGSTITKSVKQNLQDSKD